MAEPGLLGKAADLVPDALLLVRVDGIVLDWNQEASRLVPGMSAGSSLLGMVTDAPESVRHTLARWARTGDPEVGALSFKGQRGPVRCRCRGARARWLPGTVGPGAAAPVVQVHISTQTAAHESARSTDRFTTLNREVSYRQRAAAERERLLAAEQFVRDRMQRLYRLSTALASASTLVDVAGVVSRQAAESLGGTTAVLGLYPDRVLPPFREPLHQQAPRAWHDLDADRGGLLARAARSAGPMLITDPDRPLAPYSVIAAGERHSAYCAPLELRGQRLGVLAVALPDAARTLLDDQHVLSVTAQVAQAVARARLFEHEHRLAERLQRSLLPTLPAIPGLTVATRYLPTAESMRVGGDWYDLFELRDGQAGMAIGDVAGHSLSEATVMAQLYNALRAIAVEHREPGETLSRLNEFTHAFLPMSMATACYLTLDTRARRLSFANAGHLPPLLLPADGSPRLLWGVHGPPLGAAAGARYPATTAVMAPGDTLLLYTDGVVERRREPVDAGLDRLLAIARRAAGRDPEALCDVLTTGEQGTEGRDDRALLAVRYE